MLSHPDSCVTTGQHFSRQAMLSVLEGVQQPLRLRVREVLMVEEPLQEDCKI